MQGRLANTGKISSALQFVPRKNADVSVKGSSGVHVDEQPTAENGYRIVVKNVSGAPVGINAVQFADHNAVLP